MLEASDVQCSFGDLIAAFRRDINGKKYVRMINIQGEKS